MATSEDISNNIQAVSPRGSVAVSIVLIIWGSSIIGGQLVRLPLFGQSGGILPSDIANLLVVIYALLVSFRSASVIPAPEPESMLSRLSGSRIKSGMTTLALLAITPFLVWSLFVLCMHIGQLPREAFVVALSYWIRLAVTLALLPAFLAILQRRNNQQIFRSLTLYMTFSLVVLGYLQILIQPSLQGISGGWDPHNFRMLSTWLDPNFFGIFLVIVLPYVVVMSLQSTLLIPCLFIIPAIILTQSRSTFIAVVIAAALCGILYLLRIRIAPVSKNLVLLGASAAVACTMLGVTLLGDRAANAFLHDPTVHIRSDAYKAVWRNLVEPNILIGVGYNTYQFAAKDAGLISDFTAHSRAGSDSSILTLLVTTGIIGTALFFIPILSAVAFHLRKFLQTKNPYSLSFIFATLALLVQSQFTNSLLYPHILMVYIFIAAISSLPSPVLGEGGGEGKGVSD